MAIFHYTPLTTFHQKLLQSDKLLLVPQNTLELDKISMFCKKLQKNVCQKLKY